MKTHIKTPTIKFTPAFKVAFLFIISLMLSGCASQEPSSPAVAAVTESPIPSPTQTPEPTAVPTPEPTEEPFQEYDITLMALGDNLMHMGIVNTGKQADGSYEYSFLFDGISDYIARADLRVINQETILGGNDLGFSGYPRFNSPTEVGDAIAAAGFNIVLHATNHTADQGINGINNCISFWEQYPDILMAGISGEDSEEQIPLISIGEITFAILNYTYGPNLGTLPSYLRGHLNMLCNYDQKTGAIDFTSLNPQVLEDIKAADELADMVLVFPHWGTEYQTSPSSYQRKFALEMAEAGADLIIGTHPHAPQPVEWITTEDGHQTLCYYSLGNYVSTQKQAICMLEEMAWVTFHVTEEQVYIDTENSGALPLVCHYKSGPVRLVGVYPLEEYTEEMALSHGIWNYGGVALHLEYLQTNAQNILGDYLLSASDILEQQSVEP